MTTISRLARQTRLGRYLSTRTGRRTATFYVFISPWLLGFIFLNVIPLAAGILMSFTNYDGLNPTGFRFVGLKNYAKLLGDTFAHLTFQRTLVWTTLYVPSSIALSFALAMVLSQARKGVGFFRTLYYLPSMIPTTVAVWLWALLLDENNGLINATISVFRPGTVVRWLSDLALVSIVMVSVWKGLGRKVVIFLAGLQGIPKELKEAARIDGASSLQVFRLVTVPLMTPIVFFQLVLSVIGAFQIFVVPMLIFTSRGVDPVSSLPQKVYFFMVYVYGQIFMYQRFGYGTALLWILFALILVLTLLLFWSQRWWVHYEVATEGGES